MRLNDLFELLAQARRLCGHDEYVVIGSLSILGLSPVSPIPAAMTMSIDADCYTRHDPGRALDLQAELGEFSPWHLRHGIYLDPVNPSLPTLPDGWEGRLLRIGQAGVVVWFLEPHDAAISKLARGEARDLRWVDAGIRAHVLSLPTLLLRLGQTRFLDDAEQAATQARISGLQAALQPAP